MYPTEFEFPLPEKQRELLFKLVEKAKKHKIMTVSAIVFFDMDKRTYGANFTITGDGKDDISFSLLENPLVGFEALGFIIRERDNRTDDDRAEIIFLTPKLFKWVEYQEKNKLSKFFARQSIKDFMLGSAFILSLLLTVFQIIELLQKVTLPSVP